MILGMVGTYEPHTSVLCIITLLETSLCQVKDSRAKLESRGSPKQ